MRSCDRLTPKTIENNAQKIYKTRKWEKVIMNKKLRTFLFCTIAAYSFVAHAVTEAEARELCRHLKTQYPHARILSYGSYLHNYGGPDIFLENDIDPITAYYNYLQEEQEALAKIVVAEEDDAKEAEQDEQEVSADIAGEMAAAHAAQDRFAVTAARVADTVSQAGKDHIQAQQIVGALGGHAFL